MTGPAYTLAQKDAAIALAAEVGQSEAARQLSIPKGTVASWCSRGGVHTSATERTTAATAAIQATMEQRRAKLADKLLSIADLCAGRAEEVIAQASLRDVVGAWDYAIKNSQLLTGGATGRLGTDADRGNVLTEAHGRALELVTDAA